jgi:hypothetical protein
MDPEDDSLEQMRAVAKQFLGQAAKEQQKLEDMDVKFFNECLLNAHRVLRDICPYDHAKLLAIKVSGDPANPLHHVQELDLSRLTDEQLLTLRSLVALAEPARRPDDGTATTR